MDTKTKKCKVIMLPTENRYAPIGLDCNKTIHENCHLLSDSQHLYITSYDEIKEGDWYYSNMRTKEYGVHFCDSKRISELCNKHSECKKIIATTDLNLKLPEIPKSFIEKYCKVDGIDEVIVEYEYDEISTKFRNAQIKGGWSKYLPENAEFKLKVNSNNKIIIHPFKDSWNRIELELIIDKILIDHSDKVLADINLDKYL